LFLQEYRQGDIMNEERKDFDIIRLQADIILLQKKVKELSKENAAISKILIEKVKPIVDSYYHEPDIVEDVISYG